MSQDTRPDAITRAQIPGSSRKNPATPILVGIILLIIFFIIILLFVWIIPMDAAKAGEEENQNLEKAVNLSEERALHNLASTGTLYPNESNVPATPDPILHSLEQPFMEEEEKEERSME